MNHLSRTLTRSWQVFTLCLLVLAAVAVSPFAVHPATAAPVPSTTPPRWEIRFKTQHDLRLIQINGEHYWFMTYLATNRTGEDQTFVPNAVLYTDAGDIINDGEVEHEITQYLLDLYDNPLLESKFEIIGTLKYGKENAREGLLVWKAGSLDIDEVAVFISGFSSETQVVANATTGDEVVVRKSVERRYKVPGDPTADLTSPVKFDTQRWIMR